MRIGKNMKHALDFAKKHPGWHIFGYCKATHNTIWRLWYLGLVEINKYRQFRIKL